MKFRALNFDYYAEAKLRLDEKQSKKKPPSPIIWLCPPSVVQEQRRLRKQERAAASFDGDDSSSGTDQVVATVNESKGNCQSERLTPSGEEKPSAHSNNDKKICHIASCSLEVRSRL